MNEIEHNMALIGIIEDDEDVSRGLTSVLGAARYKALTFDSAESFLASPDRSRISLLVVDFRLPGMTGLQLQRQLRLESCKVPIISISAHASEPLQKLLLEDGAVAFFSKPVRGAVLVAQVARTLQQTSP